MRVLLDTNVLIHREAATVVRKDIGELFFWLDRLRYDKCVHPVSLKEIEKHRDRRVRSSFHAKLKSYQVLKTTAPMAPEVQGCGANDQTENDRNDREENYRDIQPILKPARRLKIGTFKVESNGYKLGERFLKIVFDNAIKQKVDEVYVTIFRRTIDQQRLISLLEDFGFAEHGTKSNEYGDETVYVRDMRPRFNSDEPKLTFPYVSASARAFIVPIYPEYHTTLLPDSILKTESPTNFVEQEPHRNAIRKVYVSRSHFRSLRRGDTIVFYRTGGYYKGVVTTLGIVDGAYVNIKDEAQFIALCRKRSVFSDEELRQQWNYSRTNRPFIVGFLYAYAFPKRPTLKELIDNGVIRNVESAPRGFEQINDDQLSTILSLSEADPRIIVN